MGPPPQYQQQPDDPQTVALKKQAEQDQIAAGMDRARIDSASILARYGQRVTLAAAGGGPTAAASPTMASDLTGTASTASTAATALPNLLNTLLQRTG